MEEYYPEVESLKLAIEEKMGRKIRKPGDFGDLACKIADETGSHVGVTTIKRLWGYIGSDSRMREDTLSVFARFVGCADWQGFCADVREKAGVDSAFLTGRQVSAADLANGDCVEIGWLPDRYCLVRHMGGGCFVVEKAVNGKLRVGDTFRASLFCVGQPLYVTDLVQSGGSSVSYVAGIKNGLTLVRKVEKS